MNVSLFRLGTGSEQPLCNATSWQHCSSCHSSLTIAACHVSVAVAAAHRPQLDDNSCCPRLSDPGRVTDGLGLSHATVPASPGWLYASAAGPGSHASAGPGSLSAAAPAQGRASDCHSKCQQLWQSRSLCPGHWQLSLSLQVSHCASGPGSTGSLSRSLPVRVTGTVNSSCQ